MLIRFSIKTTRVHSRGPELVLWHIVGGGPPPRSPTFPSLSAIHHHGRACSNLIQLTQKLVVRIGMEREGIESVVPEKNYEYYFNVRVRRPPSHNRSRARPAARNTPK